VDPTAGSISQRPADTLANKKSDASDRKANRTDVDPAGRDAQTGSPKQNELATKKKKKSKKSKSKKGRVRLLRASSAIMK
jgi:hypothetical protein